MQSFQDTGCINSTMRQNEAEGAEGSGIAKKGKYISPKLFKIEGLADSKSIPNRGTIGVYRQRTYARTTTNIIGKLIGIRFTERPDPSD